MPTPWDIKRQQIAQALAGGVGQQSIGAGFRPNPMMSAGAPGAIAGGGPQTQGQMMAYANQQLQGAPGFNYVPPVHVDPATAAPAQTGLMGGSTPEELRAWIGRGGGRYQPPGVIAPHGGGDAAFIFNNRMRGSDRGGYSTSDRGGGRSSSWGGAQRGGGGLY